MGIFMDKLDEFISELWDKTDTLLVLISVAVVSAAAGYIGWHVVAGWIW